MKSYYFIIFIFSLIIFNGCDNKSNYNYTNANSSDSTHTEAVKYCIEENGIVIDSNSTYEELCQYQTEYEYDDGVQLYTFTCELYTFYENGDCDSNEDEDISTPLLLTAEPTANITVGEAFHRQVKDILNNLDHTGYTHKTNGPFVLHPSYKNLTYKTDENNTEINSSIESYNLFLDCSGFVGYYVVQGIAKSLYEKIDTCYNTSRPLAADFADLFMTAEYNVSNNNVVDALLSDLDNNKSDVQWGRVESIADAKAGDILVYKHPENITPHGECNNTIHGNTGHVLFIMSTPKRSNKYTGEWIVHIADSTTAPHSSDSRYSNTSKGKIEDGSIIFNKSKYKENYYTAWSKTYKTDRVELCNTDDNNTFHRRCKGFGENTLLKIYPQTGNNNSSTGIGYGYIYIDNKMKYYRVKNGAEKTLGDVYIGRAVKNIVK